MKDNYSPDIDYVFGISLLCSREKKEINISFSDLTTQYTNGLCTQALKKTKMAKFRYDLGILWLISQAEDLGGGYQQFKFFGKSNFIPNHSNQ
jgi:hypothetical protein